MRAVAALLLSFATAAALIAGSASAHDKVGANLNFIGDFRRNHEFVDLVKQSRIFLKIGTFEDSVAANRAPVGADGWPTTDFRLFAMAAQQNTQGLQGTYKIVFNGQATLSMAAGGAGTVSNQSFDAGTNTTTADLVFPAGAENFLVDFTGTSGAVKNVRILRPGHAVTSTQLLHTPWKNHVARFPVVRFLDWTRTNGNRDITFADRMTPEKRRTEAYISTWETVIDAANSLNRDPWINVPVQADNAYVTSLATLFRDRLNSNLNVYIEYGNELWNFNIFDVDMDRLNGGTFNGASVNRDLAVASPSNSPLRFDGTTDQFTLGFRRVALRLKEISDIWRTVWGSASINTRVRPVLAGQMANSFIVSEGLNVIDHPSALNVRPNTVFYAISGAPYIFPAAVPNGNADETLNMTVQQILDGLAAGVANAPSDSNAYQYITHAGLGAWYGLKVVAYEAGFDNFGSQNVPNKRLANLDPQIRTICNNFINQWHGFGFEHILWFNAGADSYNTQFGMWPLVEDMANQATPKNQCIDDILAAALPAVTVGTLVTGGAIPGGNYRGSPNPTGSVSGNDPAAPFGFPGFAEYLLRADVEGTYDITVAGSMPPGESFRLELNNAVVAANVTSFASPIRVSLRRGLNAMRLKRATGASFNITSFTFALVGDGTPDAFSFTSQTGVAAATPIISNAATITGITIPAAVSVSGGEYSVGCTATFTSAAGTINNNQTVCVRHTSATSASTVTTTTLTIGGVSGSFSSTTAAGVTPSFTLTVSKAGSGTVTSSPSGIDCGATCAASYNSGTAVTLTATAAAGFTFTSWSGGGCSGTGTCVATLTANTNVTATFTNTNPPRLANISTRMQVLTGNDVMIAGFIIGGSIAKTVVINVAGPSLANFGITNPLANPTLTLVRSSDNAIIASNDNWRSTNQAAIQASGFAPANDLEPAILMTLAPGAYTAIVQGVGGTGVGLVGLFEVDRPEVPLINISTRGQVLTGNDVMIAGFIIQGSGPQTVVINVAGPSLSNFGITNPLANPTLTLVRSSDNAIIATNDNWRSSNEAAILASGFAPANDLEPAILMTLPPGAYTAIVQGVGGGTGVGLVGVFKSP